MSSPPGVSTPSLFLQEPASYASWFPFGSSRPVCSLNAGAFSIRERWEGTLDARTEAVFGPEHLYHFTEDDHPEVVAVRPVNGPAWVVQSDFAPTGDPVDPPVGFGRLTHDDEPVGWWIPEGSAWNPGDHPEGEKMEVEGFRLRGAFDIITALDGFLEGDAAGFTGDSDTEIPDGVVVLGEPDNVVIMGAFVEPGVVFDVRNGPVVIDQFSHVRAGTRLEGPVVVRANSHILGGDIRGSVIGAHSKVRGEITSSVFLGYGNKGHEGFVGHSVVGRWVNLGAGTTTSNLKNTYGSIRLELPNGPTETELQFLGSLFGDHAKTAIGSMMPTGTVVGVGANVFGGAVPKLIPPFAWGHDGARMTEDGFLKIAERVMPRRDVEFTDAVRTMLIDVCEHAQ